MSLTFYGSGVIDTNVKFGRLVQHVSATDKGVTSNSGNWYADYTSAFGYSSGLTICSLTITPSYSSSESRIIVRGVGFCGESPNDDGPSGYMLSWANGTKSTTGVMTVMPRGRVTYSGFNEGIGDAGVNVLGVMGQQQQPQTASVPNTYAAGDSITIYFKCWSVVNGTRVITTGYIPSAYGQFAQSTSNGAVACRSTLWAREVLF
jgi:hypothetical protein